MHFALDALDGYTDKPDDPTRLVPNPAKTHAAAAVSAAEHRLAHAETVLADAISAAAVAAGRAHNHGSATVDPAAVAAVEAARTRLDQARADRAETPARVPLATIRPDARLLDQESRVARGTCTPGLPRNGAWQSPATPLFSSQFGDRERAHPSPVREQRGVMPYDPEPPRMKPAKAAQPLVLLSGPTHQVGVDAL